MISAMKSLGLYYRPAQAGPARGPGRPEARPGPFSNPKLIQTERAEIISGRAQKIAPTHANTGLTQISTSQVQHVNNLINVVPFAAGMPGNAGMAGAGNLQLGTKRYQTKPSDSASEWQ